MLDNRGSLNSNPDHAGSQPGVRLLSLDVFRGATIALMLIVNNQGDWSHVYPMIRHAAWHGWTLTDMVFPFFLFAVGAAVPFSLSKHRAGGLSGPLFMKIIRRTLLLVALGLMLNALSMLAQGEGALFRIPGVLQRIGICYFFAAVLYACLSTRARIAVTACLLIVYGFTLALVTPEGFGRGSLDPHGNIARTVDSFLFGKHTYRHAPAPGFDPEGLLSTLSAVASTLMGVLTGELLRAPRTGARRAMLMAAAAAAGIMSGIAAGHWIPINKNLWTPAYAFFMGGCSLCVLLFCYWIIEMRGFRGWSVPFEALGRNAILAYVLSSAAGVLSVAVHLRSGGAPVSVKSILHANLFASWLAPAAASLAYSCMYLLLWTVLMYLLYRKEIFVKI